MKLSVHGFLAVAAIAVLPVLPSFGLLNGATSAKALLLLLLADVLLIVWALLLYRRREVTLRIKNPLVLGLAAVPLTHLISSLAGVYPEHSLLGDIARSTGFLFILHIAFITLALGHLLQKDDWIFVRRAVVVSSGFFASLLLLGTAGVGVSSNILWFDLSTRGMTMGNETIAGMYLLLAAVVAAVEFVRTKSLKWRWAIAAVLGLIAISPVFFNTGILLGRTDIQSVLEKPQLILGMTRATSVVYFALAGFLLAWWGTSKLKIPRVRKGIKITLATVALVGVIGGSVLHLIPGGPVQEKLADSTTLPRYIVWDLTTEAIAQKPLLGWGPENYDRAFEANFRNELYKTGGRIEGWFDKAHNVVLDTVATTGILGLLAWIFLLCGYVLVVIRARQHGAIGEGEQVLLLALPVAHLTQLQTAFDTVHTYGLLAIIGGYVLSLDVGKGRNLSYAQAKRIAIAFVIVAVASLSYYVLYEFPRQASLTAALMVTDINGRAKAIDAGLSRTSDFEGLHRTANLFVDSVLVKIREEGNDPETIQQARAYLGQYLLAYEQYLSAQPQHYRARIHYAYLLLLDAQWGGVRAQEAADIVSTSYDLSPGNPVTYVLDVMVQSYIGDYEGAAAAVTQLKEIIPDARLTQDVDSWYKRQVEIAPRHSFLTVGNL